MSSQDKSYVEDKADVIDKYIRDARSLSIKEIRSIKSKDSFLVTTLFRKISYIIVGGVITALGVWYYNLHLYLTSLLLLTHRYLSIVLLIMNL